MLERLWGGAGDADRRSPPTCRTTTPTSRRARIDGATLERIARFCDRPRSRGGLRRDAAQRACLRLSQAKEPVAGAARGLQLRRYRGRQGPRRRLLRRSRLYEGGEVPLEEAGRHAAVASRAAPSSRALLDKPEARDFDLPWLRAGRRHLRHADARTAAARLHRQPRAGAPARRGRGAERARRGVPRPALPAADARANGRNAASRCRCSSRPSRCASPTRPTCWRRSWPARTA